VPRSCSICYHKKRCEIDKSVLETNDIASVAKLYRISESALGRHVRNKHISKIIEAAAIENDKSTGLDIQKCAQEIYDIATGAAKDARAIGKFGPVGSCLSPAAKVLEILNKGNDDKGPKTGLEEMREEMRKGRSSNVETAPSKQ